MSAASSGAAPLRRLLYLKSAPPRAVQRCDSELLSVTVSNRTRNLPISQVGNSLGTTGDFQRAPSHGDRRGSGRHRQLPVRPAAPPSVRVTPECGGTHATDGSTRTDLD